MIQVDRLYKSYGGTTFAVHDVSFRVARGEVVGFLGPNGAGKTTTLRILAGFLGATSGKVTVAGHDVAVDSQKARASMGYMPESAALHPEMRVGEYLSFRAALKQVPRATRRQAVEKALELAGVGDGAEKVIATLSKGYRQRVALADAIVADPPILVLDEPTSGLDPNQIRDVRKLVRDLGRDRAVLLSTHILSEVEAACDRAIVISQGKLVAQGTLADLRKLRSASVLKVVVDGERLDDAARVVERLSLPGAVRVQGAALHVEWQSDSSSEIAVAATEKLARALIEAGIALRELTPMRASLEEIFASVTHDAPPPTAPSPSAPPPASPPSAPSPPAPPRSAPPPSASKSRGGAS